MATSKPTSTDSSSPPGLDKFLTLVEQFAANLATGVKSAIRESDAAELIDGLCSTMTTQFHEVTGFVRTETAKLGPAIKAEAETVLRLQGAEALVTGSLSSARSIGSNEKALGLAGIVREIKKIIGSLLDLFNIKPKWWEKLTNLIDEIINLILGLLFPNLARALSEAEGNYLRELQEVRRLEIIEDAWRNRGEENDR